MIIPITLTRLTLSLKFFQIHAYSDKNRVYLIILLILNDFNLIAFKLFFSLIITIISVTPKTLY
ncbi:hypothetical protein XCR1_1660006 [Xenorhabdus cabanillasii JM26]|uniref:Uncharacterized protein n=1 Tax=Xenorhabdus cabanillasii JM26 TaxID=1427517 RepID=W1IYW0_9GAMM|nr:hypothetical protein XCR1_1660006 [Xenorhabdus cabanillasii JM26]